MQTKILSHFEVHSVDLRQKTANGQLVVGGILFGFAKSHNLILKPLDTV
jgi:hypothetical protein